MIVLSSIWVILPLLSWLLVSWPSTMSSTLLHTADLLYSNSMLIVVLYWIIVTVTPSIISISSTLLSDNYLSLFQLMPSGTKSPFPLLGLITHWSYYLFTVSYRIPPYISLPFLFSLNPVVSHNCSVANIFNTLYLPLLLSW